MPVTPSGPPRPVVAASALLLAGLAGCSTINQIGNTGEDLVQGTITLLNLAPADPTAITAQAFNEFDADERRRAVADLTSGPYGGEDFAVKTYRVLLGSIDGDPSPDAQPDPDPTVRAICAKALGLHGTAADAQLIVRLLGDDSRIVRYESARALQKLHDPATVPDLIAVLRGDPMHDSTEMRSADSDGDVRAAAAEALGQYPEQRVYDALVGALSDRDFGVIHAAHQALVTLTGQDSLTTEPEAWLAFAREQPASALFDQQQAYRYEPYPDEPGIFDTLRFWKPFDATPPQAPAGLPADDDPLASAD